MHKVSELYKSLWQDPLHEEETKLVVAGEEYTNDDIVSVSPSGGIYSTPGIGNCASRQIDLEIYPKGTIPRQAKIEVFQRLVCGDQASEWIPKGVFFFSTRETNKITGTLTVTGYDSMLKAEETWLTSDYDTENWPMPQTDAVADIAYRMGVEVDDRTALPTDFPVAYPVDENGDLTMREVLSYIAVANSGNWIITDEGKLRLLVYGDIPAETNYLVTEHGDAITIGGIRILTSAEVSQQERSSTADKVFLVQNESDLDYDDKLTRITRVNLNVDSDVMYTSGDDTGRTLECTCPWGTQDMADRILETVGAVDYQPYTAKGALLDPAAELGDGITLGGIYSVLASVSSDIGRMTISDISAPGLDEIDDEYPYQTKQERETKRNLAKTQSIITKTAEQIRLEVYSEIDDLSASVELALDSISAEVRGLDNSVSALDLYVGGLTLSVTDNGTSSTIKLLSGSAEIASQNITMSGMVTYTGLENGTTVINGACIKTGIIDAERLNLTGAITWGDLSSSVQDDINDAYTMAEDAQTVANDVDNIVSGWSYVYRGTTYIDGEMLMTGTVTASTLQGGELLLLDENGLTAGSLTLTGASSYSGRKMVIDSGAIEINASYGDVYLEGGDGTYIQLSSDIVVGQGDLISNYNNRYSCGSSSHLWSDVYANNGTIVTSDLTKKNSVIYGLDAYDGFFDLLKPMSFLFNEGTSGRRHPGLGAQDVERALTDSELTSMDFAGFIKSPRKDETGHVIEGEYDYALRYTEFIPLLIEQVQKLKTRIKELEGN